MDRIVLEEYAAVYVATPDGSLSPHGKGSRGEETKQPEAERSCVNSLWEKGSIACS